MMKLHPDVIDINIAFLFGLDRLDEYKMYANNVEDTLVGVDPKWTHLITRNLEHLFYEWTKEVFYANNELKRINRHLYQPQPERVLNLMKKAGNPEATPENLKQLQDIAENCDVCQRLANQPRRFRVSLPSDDIVFNRTLLMDLMSLSSKSVFHIVC